MFLLPIIVAAVCLFIAVIFILIAALWKKNDDTRRILVLLSTISIAIPVISGLAWHFDWTSKPLDLFGHLAFGVIYILVKTSIEVALISRKLSGRYYEKKISNTVLISNTTAFMIGITGWHLSTFVHTYVVFLVIASIPIEMIINHLMLKSLYKSSEIYRFTFYSNLLSFGIFYVLIFILSSI